MGSCRTERLARLSKMCASGRKPIRLSVWSRCTLCASKKALSEPTVVTTARWVISTPCPSEEEGAENSAEHGRNRQERQQLGCTTAGAVAGAAALRGPQGRRALHALQLARLAASVSCPLQQHLLLLPEEESSGWALEAAASRRQRASQAAQAAARDCRGGWQSQRPGQALGHSAAGGQGYRS